LAGWVVLDDEDDIDADAVDDLEVVLVEDEDDLVDVDDDLVEDEDVLELVAEEDG